MSYYYFTVTMLGKGDTPKEAWTDALEHFSGEKHEIPEYEEEGE